MFYRILDRLLSRLERLVDAWGERRLGPARALWEDPEYMRATHIIAEADRSPQQHRG